MRDAPLALLCAVAAASCSYDWTVGPPAGDAGGDAPRAADATPDRADLGDASTDSPADAPRETSPPDAPAEASLSPCTPSQEAMVQQARAAALACTGVTPNPCETKVTDECGCPVYVAAPNTAEAQYVAAIKGLQASCVPLCPTGCGNAPSPGVCIVGDAGSGALACYQ